MSDEAMTIYPRTPRRIAGPSDRQRGFTILEVTITVTMVAVMLGAASIVVLKSENYLAEQIQQLLLDQTGRNVMNRLSEEIRQAYPPSVLPVLIANSNSLQFQKVTGYAGGAPVLGATVTLGFELAPYELANGKDDNGDGRIDEGFVTYMELGNAAIQIGANVLDLRFSAKGNGVAVTADVAVSDRQGGTVRRTFAQTVAYRN
jgi:prepilin-type N-terminal cleavage/methylation domain-containing protein